VLQVFHVCTSPVVQSAWAEGQELHVWGVIYDLGDGLIRRLAGPFDTESEVDDTLVGCRAGQRWPGGCGGWQVQAHVRVRLANAWGKVTSCA
jgi:hypothetical protein